jgi:hypothetical protein
VLSGKLEIIRVSELGWTRRYSISVSRDVAAMKRVYLGRADVMYEL